MKVLPYTAEDGHSVLEPVYRVKPAHQSSPSNGAFWRWPCTQNLCDLSPFAHRGRRLETAGPPPKPQQKDPHQPARTTAGFFLPQKARSMHHIIQRTYQDHSISYREDGWFNATEASAKFGKRPVDWLKLESTKTYIQALGRHNPEVKKFHFGAKGGIERGVTWMHPKLAVAFARWLDDDFAVWCDMQIDAIVRGKDDWKKSRHLTAVSYQVLSTMLQTVREQDGKETLPHHYANEARLVNWALTGAFLPIDRLTLSKSDLDLLGSLEVKDTTMIARGIPYERRKVTLKQYALDWRSKHKKPLLTDGRGAAM